MLNEIIQERSYPKQIASEYSEEKMPLGSYALLVGAYHFMLFGLNKIANKTNPNQPERIGLGDFFLLLPATHKLSRLITKDWVTSPFRAPFVEYKGSAGAGEVNESARGSGMQKAIGDLLTCQYCIGPWVAGALVYSFAAKPRQTRFFASIFALVAGSDFLHFAYQASRAKQKKVVQDAKQAMH